MREPASSHRTSDPLIGRTVAGRFRIVEAIAHGGSGRVYRAIQDPLERVVALKILAPGSAEAGDPIALRRFFLEAEVAAQLSHPVLTTIHDSGETEDGAHFLAMEYVEGKTLAEELEAGPLTVERAVNVALQLCSGLAEAHRFGIVHCDVKPSNVVLLARGGDAVKLLDFGAARFATPGESTQSGTGAGSPHYMAPEQARGERPDPRTDVYAMGVLLYHMVAGRPPFVGGSSLEILSQHAHEPARPPRLISAGIPVALQAVILRCLEKPRELRFGSMDELAHALRAAVEQEARRLETREQRARRRAIVLAVAVAAAAAAAGAALVF